MTISSYSKNVFKMYAQQITIKPDENNFLSWMQQVEGIIRTHKLHRHVVNPIIPSRYLTEVDRDPDAKTPVYPAWDQEDSLLFTWLLTVEVDCNVSLTLLMKEKKVKEIIFEKSHIA
ncbi:hypothetical protein L195_g016502 [Trifolium pratense]|uniref:Retrovirus-related Pol polyprotein from transposon TNT 1-94 n=1 Tax=Trifolium pratense TaxID=57577 RepID=A0A2K3MRB0_TRIPR|nr:hypothetical protein L195_g016502 [Trifolium pratense]